MAISYGGDIVSDVNYQLRALEAQDAARREEKAKRQQALQQGASSAYEMWSSSENLKTEQLMTKFGDSLTYSEDYLNSNPIKRMLTPSAGRLKPVEQLDSLSDPTGVLGEALSGPKTFGEALTKGAKQPLEAGKTLYEGFKEGKTWEGAKSIFSKAGEEAGKKVGEEVGKKVGKEALGKAGKVAGTLGTLYSAYDLGTNWDEKSEAEQISGAAAVALGIGSLFMPALVPYAAAASGVDMGVNLFG